MYHIRPIARLLEREVHINMLASEIDNIHIYYYMHVQPDAKLSMIDYLV